MHTVGLRHTALDCWPCLCVTPVPTKGLCRRRLLLPLPDIDVLPCLVADALLAASCNCDILQLRVPTYARGRASTPGIGVQNGAARTTATSGYGTARLYRRAECGLALHG